MCMKRLELSPVNCVHEGDLNSSLARSWDEVGTLFLPTKFHQNSHRFTH